MTINPPTIPGPIVLLGSGETLPSIGPVYDYVAKKIGKAPNVSILETPAGFQNNSEKVAQNVADFINRRLSNYNPSVRLIPARAKNSKFSPDDLEIIKPMLSSNWIFMGSGSPTYTVRQLLESTTLKYLYAMHYHGTALTFSSAAVLAISSLTLPVYEIYKVGEDLFWVDGINFLENYKRNIVFIPHWNNRDGGADLDTSRCYMGRERFTKLKNLLQSETTLIGIEEQTALCIEFEGTQSCRVFGKGRVIVENRESTRSFTKGIYSQEELDLNLRIPPKEKFINEEVWNRVVFAQSMDKPQPSGNLLELIEKREAARNRKDWDEADRIRVEALNLGWNIKDTANGPVLEQDKVSH